MSDKARPPRFGDYVRLDAVRNGAPDEVMARCQIQGCRWTAHKPTRGLGTEDGLSHLWHEHRIKITRQPQAPSRAAVMPGPYRATRSRLAGPG